MAVLYSIMIYAYQKQKNWQSLLVLLFFVFYSGQVCADVSSHRESFPLKWLELNYYHKNLLGTYKSDIINSEFFLHKNGRTNPEAEFQEFKKYVTEYIEDGKHRDALCRFPARFSLFKDYFPWMKGVKRPNCPYFVKKNQPDKVTSISLVFANGYFENPGSYYGHNLLKFNYGNSDLNQKSIDGSINYGANATDSPSNPKYIIKGLFGLYDATYTRNNDFIYTNSYTNLQMRDVWEYELNLTPKEITSLIEHNWEMSLAKFKYYFFGDNCAHKISRLITVAKGQDLFKTHGFWLTPMQVTRKLHDHGLVRKVSYHPSLQTVLFKKYTKANKEDQEDFIRFFAPGNKTQKEVVNESTPNSLLMMLDYLDLKVAKITLKRKDEEKLKHLNAERAIVLSELYTKPAEQISNNVEVNIPESPSISQPTSSVRVGFGQSDHDNFITLGYRGTNNDLLNIPTSGQEFSQFFMGDFELKKQNEDIRISKLTIAEVMNLNTNPLPSVVSKKLSWQLKLDYSERNSFCSNCGTAGIEGKIGKAKRVDDDILLYFLTGGRLHTPEKYQDSFLTGMTDVGSIVQISEYSVLNLNARLWYDVQEESTDRLYKAEFSYHPEGSLDYRVRAETDGDTSAIMFSVGFYFD